jgi:hypothetical protein
MWTHLNCSGCRHPRGITYTPTLACYCSRRCEITDSPVPSYRQRATPTWFVYIDKDAGRREPSKVQ